MYDNQKKQEGFILVAVVTDQSEDVIGSLKELEDLVETAGGVVLGQMTQNLDKFNTATFIGSGKIEELRDYIEETVTEFRDEIEDISVEETLGQAKVEKGRNYANLSLSGVNPGYFKANNIKMEAGSLFSSKAYEDGKSWPYDWSWNKRPCLINCPCLSPSFRKRNRSKPT